MALLTKRVLADGNGIAMSEKQTSINRRDFLSTAIVGAGAGLVIGAPSLLSAAAKGPDRINVALVGMGKQGGVLYNAMLNIPGLHFQAICDISPWSLRRGVGLTRVYNGCSRGHPSEANS